MKFGLAGAAALALWTAPAAAQDWPSVDDWFFTQLEKGCEMWTTYDGAGETMFSVYQQPDGFTLLGISNTEWSFESGQSYEATFVLDEIDVLSGTAQGLEVDGHRGVIAPVTAEVPKQMRDMELIQFFAEEPAVSDVLDVADSGRAIDQLEKCVAAVGE